MLFWQLTRQLQGRALVHVRAGLGCRGPHLAADSSAAVVSAVSEGARLRRYQTKKRGISVASQIRGLSGCGRRSWRRLLHAKLGRMVKSLSLTGRPRAKASKLSRFPNRGSPLGAPSSTSLKRMLNQSRAPHLTIDISITGSAIVDHRAD